MTWCIDFQGGGGLRKEGGGGEEFAFANAPHQSLRDR